MPSPTDPPPPRGPEPTPDSEVDTEHPNAARMYDWLLGGAHNFAVDRARGDAALAENPAAAEVARANRAFLHRAVGWCLDAGITQFLDLGSGVPTVGNVHEIAHARDPDARVAYVDYEPVAATSAAQLLAGEDRATITRADLRDPEAVLAAPGVADLIDFTRPVALLAVSVLHFVREPWDLAAVLGRYTATLAPGSAVAISHLSEDHDDPEIAERIREGARLYHASVAPITPRSRSELRSLFAALDGFELVAPGLVALFDWPAPQSRHREGAGFYAAVLHRPR